MMKYIAPYQNVVCKPGTLNCLEGRVADIVLCIKQVDYQSFTDTVGAKAEGSICLHQALEGLGLDSSVTTSSILVLLGNTGQGHDATANSVLDVLALQRQRSPQPAKSLVFPRELDVGIVAENEAIETSLARRSLYPLIG